MTETNGTSHDIVVIGGSAGGVEAAVKVATGLPAELSAAVFIVIHIPPDSTSALPAILSRAGPLPASHAVDGEQIVPGHIYVAPPDHHLILRSGTMALYRGPRENRNRPAVDPLFRSAARIYGSRVVGVVLSGNLDDGALGILTVHAGGGLSAVQDPSDALFPGMPASALRATTIDRVLPAAEIGPWVGAVCARRAGLQSVVVTEQIRRSSETGEADGVPSVFTCPECSGTLFERREGDLVQYRCRVGHTLSVDALLEGKSEALESALWTALRTLQEKRDLTQRVSERAGHSGNRELAQRLHEQFTDMERSASLLRNLLIHGHTTEIEAGMSE